MATHKHQVVVIGGGTGGIMVAAQLLRARKGLDVAIIEPSEEHMYQPAWTLVGAGLMKYKDTIRPEKRQIPKKASWIKEFVEDIDPESMEVKLKNGDKVSYEYLIVAAGIQMNLDGIEGLKETFGKNGVCSNYVDPDYTWETLQNFKGGVALFTQPATPIKCPGAPQKIMYLTADYFVPVFEDSVVGAELTLCNASDQTPYFLLCALGGTDSLRGFSSSSTSQ